MGYIYLLLILSLVVMVAPTLIKFFLIIWLISLVINLFRPKRRTTSYYSEETYQEETTHRKQNDDIIDVEFTQRDHKD